MSLAEALTGLDTLARRLRRDCPWDREQTAKTIVPHTIEEAYEVADAALAGDDAKLLDELGDLLFQVFFLALLLEEKRQGTLEDVARSIHDKLVRRQPRVFAGEEMGTAGGLRSRLSSSQRERTPPAVLISFQRDRTPPGEEISTAGGVRSRWEEIKREQEGREGVS